MRRYLSLILAGLFLISLYLPSLGVIPALGQSSSGGTAGTQSLGGNPRIGQNLHNPDYAPGMYLDIMYSAGPWHTGYQADHGAAITTGLTSDGFPTTGTATTWMNPDGRAAGICNFYGKGNFTINQVWGNTTGIVPGTLVPGTADNGWITTCQIQTTPVNYYNLPNPPGGFPLTFTMTCNDPSNPPDDFHLIPIEYPAYQGSTANYPTWPFSTEFINSLKPFCSLRFMDFMNTSGSTITYWSDRSQPGMWGQRAYAYENIIQLANLTGCDAWINVPINAAVQNTDWLTGFANLAVNGNPPYCGPLNPSLHLYVEVSNECWNWGSAWWPEWNAVEQLSLTAGPWSFLESMNTYDGMTGDYKYYQRGRWATHGGAYGHLIFLVYNAMQSILGNQLRCVCGGQFYVYDPYVSGAMQDIYVESGNNPIPVVYALTWAPYFGYSSSDPTPVTLDDAFKAMTDYLNTYVFPTLQADVDVAQHWGIQHICPYEWGQGLPTGGDTSSATYALALAAQTDPRMGDMYKMEMNEFKTLGVDLCNHYDLVDAWSKFGFWGSMQDIWELGPGNQPTVKYQTLANFAATCNCGTAPPPSLSSPPPPSSTSGSTTGPPPSSGSSGSQPGASAHTPPMMPREGTGNSH